jgi:formate hydrogenlyase subunit 3/multisubunit Na+/H+ antiporter MnhD subunit
LLAFSGLSGVAITGDAFNLFVFLEISSIGTYAIIAMGWKNDRRALTASFNYLVMGTIGATFFVIGIGFLYMATGTLNMADMAQRIAELPGDRVVEVGFAFILVGIGLKAALFPLHLWLPNAYAFAPNFVTTFLAATATKVAFYVIIRFSFDVFSIESAYVVNALTYVVTPLAIAGMLVGSMQALFQADARRLFAYSSVAQVGYMLLGLGMATAAGVAAGTLHLLNHALMKGALFMALGAFAYSYGVRRIDDLKGLGQAMPFTGAAFTIGASVADRRALHRRLHLEILSDPGGACERLVVGGRRDPDRFGIGGVLLLPHAGGALGEPGADGGPGAQRLCAPRAVDDRGAALGAGGREYLFWNQCRLHGRHGGHRRPGRDQRRRGPMSWTPELALALALILPLLGGAGVLLFDKQPNLREAATLISAVALAVVVAYLVEVSGQRPEITLVEFAPGLTLSFKLEPLGAVFAMVASGLWIVNSLYSIAYMRGNKEKQSDPLLCLLHLVHRLRPWASRCRAIC